MREKKKNTNKKKEQKSFFFKLKTKLGTWSVSVTKDNLTEILLGEEILHL